MSSDIEHEPWRTVEYGNLALVRAVKKRPCLYNNTLPEYSQKDVTRAAWEEIAEEFGCSVPVDELRKKWYTLRRLYCREISLVEAKKKRKPYYLANYLSFLHPFLFPQQFSRAYKTIIEATNKTFYDYSKYFIDYNEISEAMNSRESSEAMNSIESSDEIICSMETSSDAVNNITTSSYSYDVPVELTGKLNELQNDESNVNSNYSSSRSTAQPVIVQCIKANADTTVNNNCKINSENPRKQFISSLWPEVEEMTENQFQNFKRRIFQVIDDVLLNS